MIDLFDINCLLFGEFKQASGAVFNYYVYLRQIISDPALFHRVLDCYAEVLRRLCFDRIAGIPMAPSQQPPDCPSSCTSH